MKHFNSIIISIIWLIITVASGIWNYSVIETNSNLVVKKQAQSFFKEIQTTRAWNAGHGGVYVSISDKTKPNPYLNVPNREIYIDSLNIALTKVNPAFMTRQISDIAKKQNDITFHITSLKPIRPQNKADKWETIQLTNFEKGEIEVIEYFKKDTIYRYMAPLLVKKSCLRCHAKQGYKLGDIRGGISVTIKGQRFLETISSQQINIAVFHILFFFIGFAGILAFQNFAQKQLKKLKLEKQKVEESERKLRESNKTKDKFFSIISHDLQSPFTGMLGFSDNLIKNFDKYETDKQKKYIGHINESIRNANKLLKNLLLWSRSQKGTIQYKPTSENLYVLSVITLDLLIQSIERKKLKLTNQIPENILVKVDKNMFFSTFRNLLSNAIKFTEKCGKIEIGCSSGDKNELIKIYIKDNGVGISEDIQSKLFNIGENISTRGTENETGTGLGLIL